MNYIVVFAPRAEKDLRRLPASAQQRIREGIEALAADPRPHGYIKMRDSGRGVPRYRVRVGAYRVIYRIHDATITVEVAKIGDRKDIYRL